jgi:hypothetical protein
MPYMPYMPYTLYMLYMLYESYVLQALKTLAIKLFLTYLYQKWSAKETEALSTERDPPPPLESLMKRAGATQVYRYTALNNLFLFHFWFNESNFFLCT